jgi:hypothetical protein
MEKLPVAETLPHENNAILCIVQSCAVSICALDLIYTSQKIHILFYNTLSCPNNWDPMRPVLSFVTPYVSKHLQASYSHKLLCNSTPLCALFRQSSRGELRGVITKMNPTQEGPRKSMIKDSDTLTSTYYEINANLSKISPLISTSLYPPL